MASDGELPHGASNVDVELGKAEVPNGLNGPSLPPHIFIESNEVSSIREFPSVESSSISGVLRYSKRILGPYLKLLGVMGMKPIAMDSAVLCTFSLFLNKLYLVFVMVLLLGGYVLQYLTCYRRDRGFSYDSMEIKGPKDSFGFGSNICEGNPLFTHVLPSLFHFSSFLYMVYLYRFNEDEQLQNLMERVFIQAAHAHGSFNHQRRLFRTFQRLIIFSGSWVILSAAAQLLQIFMQRVFVNVWLTLGEEMHVVVVGALALLTSWQDAVEVTVIISFCIHCRCIALYLDLLQDRVQQHSISLMECIKEIGEVRKLLNYVNSDLGLGVSPLIVLNGTLFVSSLSYLIRNWRNSSEMISLGMTAVLWAFLFLLPILMASKLSTAARQVSDLGHLVRMRPFGYQETPQTDLDSFLLFVSTLKMEVKIGGVPVAAAALALTFTLVASAVFVWGLAFSH